MMRAMYIATELAFCCGRGGRVDGVNIPHPFPTPQEPYKNLATWPVSIETVFAPWRGFRPLLQNARRAWDDLPIVGRGETRGS